MKWLFLPLLLVLAGCAGCEREVFIAPVVPEMSAEIHFYACEGLPDECIKGSEIDEPPWDIWVVIEARFTGVDHGYLRMEWGACLIGGICPTASVVTKPGEKTSIIERSYAFVGPEEITLTATGVKGEYNVKTVIIV